METKFNFNSQICTTREQSERLLALGLKKETADMCFDIESNVSSSELPRAFTLKNRHRIIPAWSLHRLIEVMPMFFCETEIEIRSEAIKLATKDGNLYDYLIDVIADLIKGGYFNKEYLVDQEVIEEHCKGVMEYLDYIRKED